MKLSLKPAHPVILLALLSLLPIQLLWSLELREMQYEETPTRVIPDQSYEGWSLLVVETTIPKLSFSSTRGIKSGSVIDKGKGVWWVKLEPGVQLITISAVGYLSLTNIRHNFVNRQAWAVKVTSKSTQGGENNVLPVTIRIVPQGTEVRIDGKGTDISSSVDLTLGEHDIEITKQGYVAIKEKFIVSKNNILFEYSLQPPKLCVVEVTTEPSGAEVLIDGVKVGSLTPVKSLFNSGRYPIKITKEKFLTLNETVTIDPTEAENKFSYRLQPNTGTIVITSEPEVKMDVKANGKSIGQTPVTLKEQDVGNYEITATHLNHIAEPVKILLNRGETKKAVLKAEKNFVTFDVASEPEVGLEVKINHKPVGKTPLKDVKEAPVGNFEISGTADYYSADPVKITVARGESHRVVLKPQENFALLTIITTAGASVTLNDQPVITLKDIKLTPQTVRLKAVKTKNETREVTEILRRGDRKTVDLTLSSQVGTIAIEVDPINAGVKLTGDAGEVYSSTGTKIFSDIPIGTYEVKVSANGYSAKKLNVRLVDGASEQILIALSVDKAHSKTDPQPSQPKVSAGSKLGGHFADMVFVQIPGGSFIMGSNEGDSDEKPVHRVAIQPFKMQTTEVTQAQWQALMGSNPSYFKGDNLPVEQVSWNDCLQFIQKLNQRNPGQGYRFPTEAEWEYACRAGTTTDNYTGISKSDLEGMGWYYGNSGGKTHPVGEMVANAFGLHDMHGNVWEWCEDWYHDSYIGAPTDGCAWLKPTGSYRALRGGSWLNFDDFRHPANRSRDNPGNGSGYIGFRLVCR